MKENKIKNKIKRILAVNKTRKIERPRKSEREKKNNLSNKK